MRMFDIFIQFVLHEGTKTRGIALSARTLHNI